VGDYELGAPLAEGDGWQDFLAKHVSLGVARRVRVYPFARAASPEERKRLGRMAAREFRVLEGIDHPGILRVLHFEESELGPALVFEHSRREKAVLGISESEYVARFTTAVHTDWVMRCTARKIPRTAEQEPVVLPPAKAQRAA
jgi:Ser/Thr protein kinase RdoA (MazF antagonist)